MSKQTTRGEVPEVDKSNEQAKYACPYCQAVFNTYEAIKAHVLSAHTKEPLPEPEGTIHIIVNGQNYTMQVEPEWTLFHSRPDRFNRDETDVRSGRLRILYGHFKREDGSFVYDAGHRMQRYPGRDG